MKKSHLISILCLLLGLVIGVGGYLIYDLATEQPAAPAQPVTLSGDYAGTAHDLVDAAYQVLSDLKNGDYASLSAKVHPVFGVYFSPYSNINLSSNQWFAPNTLSRLGRDGTERVWGVYDGSGEPISMTAAEYFARFVYDRDYLYAPVVSVNRVARSGNSLENTAEAFPDGRFVDFYIPSDSSPETNWSLLRLVFVDHEGVPMLAAIVHSEYTV